MTAGARISGLAALQLYAEQLARWSAIALGFSVIVSTALDNVLMVLLLVGWLADGRWKEKAHAIRSNPVAISAICLLLLGVAGMLWSQGEPSDIELFGSKYNKLLLVPLVATVLTAPNDRRRGLLAVAAALVITLALSYALSLGVVPEAPPITGHRDNPTVFKNYLTHNVFMAYGVLLFVVLAWRAQSVRARWLWAVAAGLASFNVLFMVHGRTGYLILAALVMVTLFARLRWRGLALAAVLVGLVFAGGFMLSQTFNQRVRLLVTETQRWDPSKATSTSVGTRLQFYRTTLEIIRRHPLIGVGTGGFPKVYAGTVVGTELNLARNPHNQYLLTTAELGIIGLAVLLFFFYCHARAGSRLPDAEDRLLARGLLVLMLIGSLFNSLLLDHAEGVFFTWLTGLLLAGLPAERETRDAPA
jgi:O-antigen ligase